MIDLLSPPLVLLIGAGLIMAVSVVPVWRTARWNRYWHLGLIAIALITVLFVWPAVAPSSQVTQWSSLPILTPSLALQGNKPAQYLGAGLLVTLLAITIGTSSWKELDGIHSGEDQASPATKSGKKSALLIVLATSLVSILPANLLTLVLAWAILDCVTAVTWLIIFRPETDDEWRRFLINGSSGLIATLFLWSANLPLQANLAFQDWGSLHLEGWAGIGITLAVLFRLSPYPLHLLRRRAWPNGGGSQIALPSALQAGSVTAGIWLMAHIPGWASLGDLELQLFSALLLTGLAACGLLAWLSDQQQRAAGWILTGQAGIAALAGMWAGPDAGLAEGMVLILAGGLLAIQGKIKERSTESLVAGGIGIAALAGFPLTWGANGRFLLYQEWLDNGWGLYLLLATGAQLLILAAAGRLYLGFPSQPAKHSERLILGLALALPSATLLIKPGPLFPQGSVLVWLAIVAAAGGGALLAWGAETIQSFQVQAATRLRAPLTLGWLRRLTINCCRLVGRAAQSLHSVLEGEGALLWVLILLILGWLMLSNPAPG